MREKIAIAKALNASRKHFSKKHRKLCFKCIVTFVVECILKGKNEFKITVDGKYIQSFPKRVSDWYNYVLNAIYTFFLIQVTPKENRNFHKRELIESKPIHLKVPNMDELVLESFLKVNGFKIVGEHLYYIIARI